jgi:hypothetical protein
MPIIFDAELSILVPDNQLEQQSSTKKQDSVQMKSQGPKYQIKSKGAENKMKMKREKNLKTLDQLSK